jgi:hypothetical protein
MKRMITVVCLVGLIASVSGGGQVGFEEEFALAKDRDEVLKQLIPGTQEYYFYTCLHAQNTGRLDRVDELLKPWVKRYGNTSQMEEIRNRQALLRYKEDPQKSLAFLKWRLGLTFNHKREPLEKRSNLPTALDPTVIDRDRLTQLAMRRNRNLAGFESTALDWLVDADLTPVQRRDLLKRLERPDYDALPRLVADDLKTKESRGFGEFKIHKKMLLSQLDALLELKSDLLNHSAFVTCYLSKLAPADGVDWRHDVAEHRAYLDRLWTFAASLAPVHNTLKANVLYQQLRLDRSHGTYNRERFMRYIKLPRAASYVNPLYLKKFSSRSHRVNLSTRYDELKILPPLRRDEPLVRSYLMHFFIEDNAIAAFEEYLRDDYLKPILAETKLTRGLGDAEKWFSMLSPTAYQALQDRVDIDFAHTNAETFGPEEAVSLDVEVKNVKTLIVKVFEINARNYYQANDREVRTDINLDGLVPNEERVETYSDAPVRRLKRHFTFPRLKNRGVYVVEFIGNGKSSRALIRKGKLNTLVRTSIAGQVLTVLDESNRVVTDATLWMAGREYAPDDDGKITVPFSTKPGDQTAILCRGDFASLIRFQHAGEKYHLAAGIFVDRESLLGRKTAQVAVRPMLYVNHTPVTLSLLEQVKLVITSTDIDGVSSTKEVPNFKLFEDRESVHEFRVPEKLRRLHFTLQAKVKVVSRNDKEESLLVSDTFDLNGIDATYRVEDLHLGHIEGQYVIDVLGKTGEPRAGRAVALRLKHRDFTRLVDVSLQSDASGRIRLGALKDIRMLHATGPEGTTRRWPLVRDRHGYPAAVQGATGDVIRLPYMGAEAGPERSAVSLLEERGDTFVADRFAAVTITGGMIELRGLPAGTYDLLLKGARQHITVRLAEGPIKERHVLSKTRYLEILNPSPLQIQTVTSDEAEVRIALANSTEFARVHVVATRYMPEYPLYDCLRTPVRQPSITTLATSVSDYVAGRSIGDEYQYIIDRKYARKFPGNMLTRPGLLLNPWAIGKTRTDVQTALRDSAYGGGRGGGEGGSSFFGVGGKMRESAEAGFSSFEFLKNQSVVLLNLAPDANGVVTIKRDLLDDRQQLHVLAVDPESTTYREISLAEQKAAMRDLRLLVGFDPKDPFTEQKQVSVIGKGKTFRIADITSSQFEVYDSLTRVYGLYMTLSGNATLAEFQFVLRWPTLKDEEKREKYSKYACHELSFYLYHKDPDFFRKVVAPYLANKKDKTFMDHWLLGDDLSGYVRPWQFEQLNVVEQALLGQRIDAGQAAMGRHVKDQYDLIPPNVEEFSRLFKTALQGSSLDAGSDGEFDKALGLAVVEKLAKARAATAVADRSAGIRPGRTPSDAPAPSKAFKDKMERAENLMSSRKKAKAQGALKLRADEEEKAKGYYKSDKDAKRRRSVRRLYRKLDKTQEWAENNYYHLPIGRQNASLVTVNGFWNDYAAHGGKPGFQSDSVAEAARSFTEMMLALAVLDLPLEAAEHKTTYDGATMTKVMGGPAIVFHKEIRPAQPAAQKTPVLVSQNMFRYGDRYRHEGNEKIEKVVTGEFLAEVVYGCHVVITNPTSARKKLDLLLQIPRGAIAVSKGKPTRSIHVNLEPYRTQTVDYYFYFPFPGEFAQYPVHVAREEKLVARTQPVTLKVVEKLSKIDTASWDYISQHGSEGDVVSFLKQNNLNRVKLSRIAWRMHDKAFFGKALALLGGRHVYDHTLWSYGIHHNAPATIRPYLLHQDSFLRQCGAYIDTPLVTIDPVERKAYEHLEYSPLVNARAHRLGKKRVIVNDKFFRQYQKLMTVLRYRPRLDAEDRMAVTYYLLLQDRVEEGLAMFKTVAKGKLPTGLQYDYFDAYTSFYRENPRAAASIAARYADYPVERWRKLFANVQSQVDEIEGKAAKVVDEKDRTQTQSQLAATEASFDFKVESKKITVDYQNVSQCTINYYLMDIELMFSRQPFVQEVGGQFSYIRPNLTQTVALPQEAKSHIFDLPEKFHASNVLVEITSGGTTKSQAYYSRSMAVQVIENYGQVKVTKESTGKPLAKVYVKVYARKPGGKATFYKDGYTDLRGRFDYTSLSTNELDSVERFALLILSDTDGVVVREAMPPKR